MGMLHICRTMCMQRINSQTGCVCAFQVPATQCQHCSAEGAVDCIRVEADGVGVPMLLHADGSCNKGMRQTARQLAMGVCREAQKYSFEHCLLRQLLIEYLSERTEMRLGQINHLWCMDVTLGRFAVSQMRRDSTEHHWILLRCKVQPP